MMDKDNINIKMASDLSLLEDIGNFIRQQRLEQDKTQSQLAEEAGICRSTLVELEQGKRSNTITLIQVLRALSKLEVFENFRKSAKVSPLLLAKLERESRKRASGKDKANYPQSDW